VIKQVDPVNPSGWRRSQRGLRWGKSDPKKEVAGVKTEGAWETAETETELIPLWERVDVRRGDVLCRQGDPWDSLYLVRSGRVEILPSPSDPRGPRVVRPGEFFGELDFSERLRSPVTVRALEDTALLRIDGRVLARQLAQRRGGEPLRVRRLLGCGDRLVFLG
jgi:hypothetical protein